MTGAGPSWEDTLTGPADAGAARAAGGVRNDARHVLPRRPAGDPEPRADRWLTAWLACVVVGCLTLVVGTGWVAGVAPAGDRDATATPAAAQEEPRSVLAVLTDSKGAATAAAVVGVSQGRTVCLLTPRQLGVDSTGTGRPVPLQQAVRADRAAAARALSGTLGVRVDDTWRLTGPQLAGMVEAVGGVDVDPKIRVYGGKVDQGEQRTHLDGAQAARWTAVLPKGTRDDVRLARFHAVLLAVITRLPEDERRRAEALRALHDREATTLSEAGFVELLSVLHERHHFDTQVVPVSRAEGGRYAVNLRKYRPLLAGPLAPVASGRRLEGQIQVVVGPSVDGTLARQAEEKLQAARIGVLDDPAATKGADGPPKNTTITVPSDADRAAAERVRRALGLPGALIEVRELAAEFADVFIQLGQDFRAVLAGTATARTG